MQVGIWTITHVKGNSVISVRSTLLLVLAGAPRPPNAIPLIKQLQTFFFFLPPFQVFHWPIPREENTELKWDFAETCCILTLFG